MLAAVDSCADRLCEPPDYGRIENAYPKEDTGLLQHTSDANLHRPHWPMGQQVCHSERLTRAVDLLEPVEDRNNLCAMSFVSRSRSATSVAVTSPTHPVNEAVSFLSAPTPHKHTRLTKSKARRSSGTGKPSSGTSSSAGPTSRSPRRGGRTQR